MMTVKNILPFIDRLENYVVLKKDNSGYYVEYAFIPGAPHDNRCLSVSGCTVGKVYRLHSSTCGWGLADKSTKIQYPDHVCRVGCPPKATCMSIQHGWSYYNPGTCACWYLKAIGEDDLKFPLTIKSLENVLTLSDNC